MRLCRAVDRHNTTTMSRIRSIKPNNAGKASAASSSASNVSSKYINNSGLVGLGASKVSSSTSIEDARSTLKGDAINASQRVANQGNEVGRLAVASMSQSRVPQQRNSADPIQRAEVSIDSGIEDKLKTYIEKHPAVAWFSKPDIKTALIVKLGEFAGNKYGETNSTPGLVEIVLNKKLLGTSEESLGIAMETFTHEIGLHGKPFAERLAMVSGLNYKQQERAQMLRQLAAGDHKPLVNPYPAEFAPDVGGNPIKSDSIEDSHAKAWVSLVMRAVDDILAEHNKTIAGIFVRELSKDMEEHSSRLDHKSSVSIPAQKKLIAELKGKIS